MSLGHGASIVRDGLIFAYDMGNPQKSWKGATTTNLLQSTDFTTGWQGYCGNTSNTTYNTPDVTAPDGSNTALRHVRGSETGCGQGASWGLLHLLASPMIAGQPYTISVWARTNGPTFNVTLGHNDAAGTGISLNSQWQRFSFTYTPGNTDRGFQFINGNLNTTTYWWRPQCEVSSFATPFVNGTRSNTQALLDWTSNNTITANSLTYNSYGTFSFGNSANYASVPYNASLDLVNNVTLEAWLKYTSTTNTVCIEKSNNNTHYQFQIFSNAQGSGIGGELVFMLQPNSSNWVLAGEASSDGNWHHVIGTYNRSTTTARIYIDGILKNTNSSISTGPTTNTQPLLIGSRSGASGFGGSISDVKIYNRTLSASEIAQNFQALRGRYGI